jgi:ribonuclease HI
MEWTLNFDASITRNPGGQMSYGFEVRADNGDILARESGPVEGFTDHATRTVNTAELSALLAGLEAVAALESETPEAVRVYGDSKLAVNLANGRWKTKKPHLARLAARVRDVIWVIRSCGVTLTVEWVPREQNARADALAGGVVRV